MIVQEVMDSVEFYNDSEIFRYFYVNSDGPVLFCCISTYAGYSPSFGLIRNNRQVARGINYRTDMIRYINRRGLGKLKSFGTLWDDIVPGDLT